MLPIIFLIIFSGISALQGPKEKLVRILAFGDSLTEGMLDFRKLEPFYPYATVLQSLMKQLGDHVKVNHSGVSGERVNHSMRLRLQTELQRASTQGIWYDWVILLGGINDIGYGADNITVFEGLLHMYKTIHRYEGKVVAVTCMENAASLDSEGQLRRSEEHRRQLNVLIRQYCMKHGVGDEGALLLDLDKLIPYVSLETEEKRLEMFSDGLHLTKKGYNKLAQLAYDVLKPMITAEL
ncbi:hypothetical protein CEUSTIGMA_g7343.t1 [Chlamydomonas eustigma]|uniref:SGNH hydrolase-type esterase domain-containing protein n=1 Tax=Chlamydomonas eustigma TaxID=1157962 RepID=A0A250X9W1_9CHLO|nr:hypothetical protein CEUSTIGMA_g7343.t1 [Chlamydomonas eustigma]|eukprot:GAX79903.1 hypothetical protein CEUSTIGMA_g7343.t1 [Chlamydomonas eustigma]